ncbi:hypothetical protein [Nocardioides sp. P5_C9_2]
MTSRHSISALADITGWTEGEILVFCGAAVGAGCATALIASLHAADKVLEALPRTR